MGLHGSQGDLAALSATITDEMLTEFAVLVRWDDMAEHSIIEDPANLTKWGAIARAVHRAV
jgi:hypothetical protein